MKRFTKRLLCVLLTLIMVTALCACDFPFGKPSLEGEWETYLDMTDYLNNVLGDQLNTDDIIDEFSIRLVMEFDDDGTFTMYFDEEHTAYMVAEYADDFWDVMIEMYADQMGMSEPETEKYLEGYGITKQTLLDQIDLTSMFKYNVEGYWMLEDDQLYLSVDEAFLKTIDPVEIEFDGKNCFSIIDGDVFTDGVDEKIAEIMLPMVFERV